MAPYMINELKWYALTALINEIKGPQSFLKSLLFSSEDVLSTETAELSYLVGDRVMAPFVKKNGEAISVEGLGKKFATVDMPNIRIKHPFTPSELLFGRQPGTVIFPSAGDQISAIEAHIARDIKFMKDQIINAEEWLAAQAIKGTVEYEVADEAKFTVTFPKPAGHTSTVAPLWSAVSHPEEDIMDAKRMVSDECGLSPTHMLLGRNASKEFLKNAEVRTLLDMRRANPGGLTFNSNFDEQGALFLGDWQGLQVWEYGRRIGVDGVATPLVRDDYAEIVTASPQAENVTMYGAIPDMDAFQGRKFQGKIFSKSWLEKDPSLYIALAHSRPLCVPRRPGSMVSYKVV